MRTWRPRPPVVLVVDDDPDILRLLAMCLEAEGCVVHEADSAASALPTLTDIDVVVVDQRMPEMSGTDLITAARARGERARFLVVSGKRGARNEAQAAGAEAFLAKPIGMRELITEVERLFYMDSGASPHTPAGGYPPPAPRTRHGLDR